MHHDRGVQIAQQLAVLAVAFLQQVLLFAQLFFLAPPVVDVEGHADQAVPALARVVAHDLAVIGVPDPGPGLRADPEFAAVLGGQA
ncbi:hypothetical protein LP420_15280 [Massilia sp. B-10]|nr:hypothetical protein LP420_15280 [Massilia sp. B-10]